MIPTRTFIRNSRPLVAAALVLATTGLATADHYPRVPRSIEKRDSKVVDSLSRLLFADSTSITVDVGLCDCLEPTCDDGTVMVSCGGDEPPLDAMTCAIFCFANPTDAGAQPPDGGCPLCADLSSGGPVCPAGCAPLG